MTDFDAIEAIAETAASPRRPDQHARTLRAQVRNAKTMTDRVAHRPKWQRQLSASRAHKTRGHKC